MIALEVDERARLEEPAASRTAPTGPVQRAAAVLACAEGMSNAAIARRIGRHVDTVRAWPQTLRHRADGRFVRSSPTTWPFPAQPRRPAARGPTYGCWPPSAVRPGSVRLAGRMDPWRRRPQAPLGPRLAHPSGRPRTSSPAPSTSVPSTATVLRTRPWSPSPDTSRTIAE
ncbi:helix-turn-helix domain-containing protein [Streptomyces spinoverrucosus]|uniref:helix-turn-helix domain-containing protein n=1 Tax=Streptomyces spinoverrucosus TaxID=284043 RepID=UPI003570CAAD